MNLRTVPAALCALAVCSSAAAQDAPTPDSPEALNQLYACAAVAEDAARLACYDSAAGRLRQEQTEGRLVAIDRVQAEALQRESFGFELPSLASLMPRLGGDSEEVEAQVSRLIGQSNGAVTFVMNDGQRWTQIESRSARNVRPGDTVHIRRAALGSYMLVAEHGPSHRVRREQ